MTKKEKAKKLREMREIVRDAEGLRLRLTEIREFSDSTYHTFRRAVDGLETEYKKFKEATP